MTPRQRFLTIFAVVLVLTTLPAAAEIEQRSVNNGNVVLESVPEIPTELKARLNRYLNTRSAGFRGWTQDGSALYIATRFANVTQLHRLDRPAGARRQLTFFDEPVGGVDRRPHSDLLTFTMDAGGNEFAQIFTLDPKSGQHTMLTDGESRNGAVQWSENGEQFAFQSTRRNGKSNDVWLMDPDDPDSARIIVESPDGTWWGPIDWNPDDSRLLIANYVSVTDSRIHLLDVESGELKMLVGDPDEPFSALGAGAQFSADGKGLFFATDKTSDFTQLAYLDLESLRIQILTPEIPWNVSGFGLSEDRQRGAFTTNEGGMSAVYLFDPGSFEYSRVENLPVGLAFGAGFSPDGSQMALTLNTASTPSDVFTLALGEGPLESGELTRWTYSEVGGLATDSFVEPQFVRYPTFDDREIPAFVYKPSGDGPFPVIVSIHGGPESQYRPGFSSTFQSWVAELGAAVIAPNVRGSSGYGKEYVKLDNGFNREDSVKDIGALLDWIEQQPDLDADRVAVYGGSYGGYMVLASMVHYSDRLRAGVDIVGISNFVTFLENTQDYRRDLRRVEYGDERNAEMAEHLQKISPNNNADQITAPLFVAQGQNDPRVPVTEAQQIVEVVRQAGYDVWYMNALNEGHGFRKKENSDLYRQIVVEFFRKHLLGPVVENVEKPTG